MPTSSSRMSRKPVDISHLLGFGGAVIRREKSCFEIFGIPAAVSTAAKPRLVENEKEKKERDSDSLHWSPPFPELGRGGFEKLGLSHSPPPLSPPVVVGVGGGGISDSLPLSLGKRKK